jgi:threonine synthase
MVGVQSAAVQPIAEAFRSGSPTVEEWRRATKTIASGIADPLVGYPQDGTLTLASIRSSRGLCLSVSDETAIATGRALAESEGIFVEPTSATGVAAVAELVAQGAVRASDTVVVLLTGHGLKTPDAYLDSVPEPPVVDSVEMLIELA